MNKKDTFDNKVAVSPSVPLNCSVRRKKHKPLSDVEWTLIWASLRYFVGRETIASATFPADIIQNYYARMSDAQKKMLARDIYEHFDRCGRIGNEKIDQTVWLKFAAALDDTKHFQKTLSDGSRPVLFQIGERIYPLGEYLRSPHHEIYVPDENIVG
jgi:hypothetical protein